jgi:anti-sigma factor RsiW
MATVLELLTEEDLHEYVDGRLSREDREALEAYLHQDDEARQRVQAYQRQIANLVSLYRDVASTDPSPDNVDHAVACYLISEPV